MSPPAPKIKALTKIYFYAAQRGGESAQKQAHPCTSANKSQQGFKLCGVLRKMTMIPTDFWSCP
jgi:hypothetical protein